MTSPPAVTLLTDYGAGGEYVGALHLVVAAGCPGVPQIDIAHDIPPGDVAHGARVLARTAPLLAGAVHLAVVDPGVGGPRRALALALEDGGALVGPDNGLLMPAAAALGLRAAVELHPAAGASATFHGRDLFAPAAARLAGGASLAELGDPLDPGLLVQLDEPRPVVAEGSLQAPVVAVDHFGNLELAADGDDLAAAGWSRGDRIWAATGERRHPVTVATTFSDVAPRGALLHIDSHGRLALAVNGGSAATRIDATVGSPVTLGRW